MTAQVYEIDGYAAEIRRKAERKQLWARRIDAAIWLLGLASIPAAILIIWLWP